MLRHRVWGWCGRSATIAWAYALIGVGVVLDVAPLVCDLANAPEVQTAITEYAGPHASHVLKTIGVVTALVRIRSLRKGN